MLHNLLAAPAMHFQIRRHLGFVQAYSRDLFDQRINGFRKNRMHIPFRTVGEGSRTIYAMRPDNTLRKNKPSRCQVLSLSTESFETGIILP